MPYKDCVDRIVVSVGKKKCVLSSPGRGGVYNPSYSACAKGLYTAYHQEEQEKGHASVSKTPSLQRSDLPGRERNLLFDTLKPIGRVDHRKGCPSQHHQTQLPRLIRHISLVISQTLDHFIHNKVHQLIETFENTKNFATPGELDTDLLIDVLCQVEDRLFLWSFGLVVRRAVVVTSTPSSTSTRLGTTSTAASTTAGWSRVVRSSATGTSTLVKDEPA